MRLIVTGFIKTTDHRPTDYWPTDQPTDHLPTDPPSRSHHLNVEIDVQVLITFCNFQIFKTFIYQVIPVIIEIRCNIVYWFNLLIFGVLSSPK